MMAVAAPSDVTMGKRKRETARPVKPTTVVALRMAVRLITAKRGVGGRGERGGALSHHGEEEEEGGKRETARPVKPTTVVALRIAVRLITATT